MPSGACSTPGRKRSRGTGGAGLRSRVGSFSKGGMKVTTSSRTACRRDDAELAAVPRIARNENRLSAEVLLDRCLDVTLRDRADHAPLLHAVLKEDEERDAHGAVLHGGALVLVDVELADAEVAAL